MMLIKEISIIFLFIIHLQMAPGGTSTSKCFPGMECFPSNLQFYQLSSSLDGEILLPNHPTYDRLVVMKNTRVTKFPFAIAIVLSTADIQRCVKFAVKYNLGVTIQSSGHDYNGRSTKHGSFQIYLGNMTQVRVNMTSLRNAAGEVTCESGTTLMRAYTEVDKYDRVIVGGNSGTVCVGGYTLGGGTSPLSRKLGLAVDNFLEAEMVTYDGRIVVCNGDLTKTYYENGTIQRSRNNDLFWALRGGGGGTFGIVTKYTFKMHEAPPSITAFACMYPIYLPDGSYIGPNVLRKYVSMLSVMPPEWGGYLLMGGTHRKDNSSGYIIIAQNYFGSNSSTSKDYMNTLKNFHPEWQIMCQYTSYSSFLDYIKTSGGHSYQQEYLVNTLMQNDSFTDEWIEFVLSNIMDHNITKDTSVTATGTLLGGTVQSLCSQDTSVHPGFRSALMSFTMTVRWGDDDSQIENNVEYAKQLGQKLSQFGSGMFPNNAGAEVSNWQTEFWGDNYGRLLKTKRQWDPDNFFTCSQCVGSVRS